MQGTMGSWVRDKASRERCLQGTHQEGQGTGIAPQLAVHSRDTELGLTSMSSSEQ